MNKKILLILLLLIPLFTINVYAEEENTSKYTVLIEDDAKLLSEEEIKNLEDIMLPLTEYGNVAFKTINENNYGSTSNYASNYYHQHFNRESGSLFLIDMQYRNIYIFSDGENFKYITRGKAEIITDNIYTYASQEQYYECAKIAFGQMKTVLSGGKIAEPMRYASNVVISIVLACLLNFLFVVFSMNVKKSSEKELLKTCNINMNISNITGRVTGHHKEYSPVNSSSGSGFSSGGGGGFSGGGGGGGGGGGHGF